MTQTVDALGEEVGKAKSYLQTRREINEIPPPPASGILPPS
jgi:hypothetical protein